MGAHPWSELGLILGMVGVAVIFIWGPPQPLFQEYVGISVEDDTPMDDGRTAKEHVADEKRKKKLYKRMSSLGLGLIFIGFLLQFIDSWKS
jgi:hypothetical protein